MRGAEVDWDGFDKPYQRHRVALPTYPFERQRYWIETAGEKPVIPQPGRQWDSIAGAARLQASQAPLDLNVSGYVEKWAALNALALGYITVALHQIGLFQIAGERLSAQSAVERFGIRSIYERLLHRWLNRLAEQGLIDRQNEDFIAIRPLGLISLQPLRDRAERSFSDNRVLLDYTIRCGEIIAEVITGKKEALETLVPDGTLDALEVLYERDPVGIYANSIARAALEAYVRVRAGGAVRVLEIGAGVGGTTSSLLPVLPRERTVFHFTDLSESFFKYAENRFRDYPFIRYGRLDIERESDAQGYPHGSMNVVTATNVLHATRDLCAAVKNAASLLAPGGLLILSETAEPFCWLDATAALISGWQRYDDGLREDQPLLPAAVWAKLLEEAGFERIISLPGREFSGCHPRALSSDRSDAGRRGTQFGGGHSCGRSRSLPFASSGVRCEQFSRGDIAGPSRRASQDADRVCSRTDSRDSALRQSRSGRPRPTPARNGNGFLAGSGDAELLESCAWPSKPLPATLVYDHPTVEALTAYIERDVLLLEPDEAPESAPAAMAKRALELESLDDSAVEALLLEKLRSFKIMPSTIDSFENLSPLKRALLAIEDLQGRVQDLQRAKSESIAIIGMGCRFPGAENPDAFWRLLATGEDAIREFPPSRWNINEFYDPDPDAPGKMSTRWAGLIDNIDRFEPEFFGISPREAINMDPQQRLLLEVCWESLENAGYSPRGLKGTPTGVFLGMWSNEYGDLVDATSNLFACNAYSTSGILHSVAGGRISYTLGLEGPNLSIDTACSSSLVAVHTACLFLRMGECRTALAGGCNAILSPQVCVSLSKAHMMAADGRCKTFDSRADGFVRGEGCGMVVLKRLSHALADRDHILAVIDGSAANHDGHSSGLSVPSRMAQEAAIRQALSMAGVAGHEIDYVESHGTGTSLGDPIEAHALAAIYGVDRSSSHPLVVGAVKTNIGHLESAAGIAGLIKAVLSLEHEQIPANLHFREMNPHIDWAGAPVRIPVEAVAWPRSDRPRRAGVSSFGFSGTNAHVIVEEAPESAMVQRERERPAHLLVLSARAKRRWGSWRSVMTKLWRVWLRMWVTSAIRRERVGRTSRIVWQ